MDSPAVILLDGIFVLDPKKRLSATAALRSEFIKNYAGGDHLATLLRDVAEGVFTARCKRKRDVENDCIEPPNKNIRQTCCRKNRSFYLTL